MTLFACGTAGSASSPLTLSSVDAVIVVAALFGLVAFARSLKRFEARHFRAFILLLVVLVMFAVVLYAAGNHLGGMLGPELQKLEADSSP